VRTAPDTVTPQLVLRDLPALPRVPANLHGAVFQGESGVRVKDGVSVGGFGFLLMTQVVDSWTIDLYRADGTTEGQCVFASKRVDCRTATGR